jgi:phage shock protein E
MDITHQLASWTPTLLFLAAVVGVFAWKRFTSVSPAQVRSLLAEGALVIDVRAPEEFRGGNVPGAINIPLDTLASAMPQRAPDKNRPLLLHCLSGMRSGMARRQLLAMGYTRVHNLGSLGRARSLLAAVGK